MRLRNQSRGLSRPRRSRQGFTLLELLLVMAILVVLAGLASFAVLSIQKNSYARSANVEIATLANACTMYKLNVGSFPNKLVDLTTQPSGLDQATWGGPYLKTATDRDPWNRKYEYTANDQNDTVVILSLGADGQKGTPDDVSNSQGNNQGT